MGEQAFSESLNKRFFKSDGIVTRKIADETIIVPISNRVADLSSIFTLNETATLIWQLINGRTNVGEIVEAVCQQYEISREDAVKDVEEFLQSLESAGLISYSA